MVRSVASRTEAGVELVLGRLRRVAPLTPAEAAAVAALAADVRMLEPGESLIVDAGGMPLILDGWACKRSAAAGPRPQIFTFVLPGDPTGAAPGAVAERGVQVSALTSVLWVDGAPLLAQDEGGRARHPNAVHALETLARRAEGRLVDHVQRLAGANARDALGHLLLELHGRQEEAGAAAGPRFPFPVDRRCLADCLAISDLHLSRLMTDLSKRGRLLRGRGWLCLPQMRELADEVAYRGPSP